MCRCRIFIGAAVMLLLSNSVLAACIVATPAAEFCESGAAAAVALIRANGFGRADAVVSMASEQLRERGGCIRAGLNADDLDIRAVAQELVTLSEGTVEVLSVFIDGATHWYIAQGFLNGVCDRK